MPKHTPGRFNNRGTKRKDLVSAIPQSTLGELIESHVDFSLEKAQGISLSALAESIGMSKSYLSRLESNAAEARISTLSRVVEGGLGGKLRVTIELPRTERGT